MNMSHSHTQRKKKDGKRYYKCEVAYDGEKNRYRIRVKKINA